MKKCLPLPVINLLLIILIAGIFACTKTKKTLPVVTTKDIGEITQTTASCGGEVVDEGDLTTLERGVCWGSEQNPSTSDKRTLDGKGIGSFSSALTGLIPGTRYYVRAYATNSLGTGYGSQISFETNPLLLPVCLTGTITDITQISASAGGQVTNDGGAAVTARGICWGIIQNPDISGSKTSDGTGTGSFTGFLTGLSAGTTYYVRSYAINTLGTGYGNQISFTTNPILLPTLVTSGVTSISATGGKSGGILTSDGGGPISVKGVCWSISHNPTVSDFKSSDGTGGGTYISSLTGLNPGTTYYVRAYAQNSAGIAYGNEVSFTTSLTPASCTNLLMTTGIYPETGDLISLIQTEYGNKFTIADWSDLKAISDIDSWIACVGLKEDQNFWILLYGNNFYGGGRHYFVTYSTDGVAGTFLVHDQIANKLFLGSWYGFNFNILAKKIQ